MSLVETRALVDGARAAGHGVAAFNVVALEHAEGVAQAAERAGSAAILQVSANAVAFRGALEPLAAGLRAIAEAARAPLALHLDHATNLALCRRAAAAGFSSVMFDAADAPDAANAAATAEAVAWGHAAGLWVEGELGVVGGKPGAVADGMTDPAAAAAYVARTHVDGLAVAVGSEHKMERREARLDLARIAALRAAVPAALVLHGSSGIPDAALSAAVAAGMVKVNVGTRLGMAWLAGFDEARGPRDADPRRRRGARGAGPPRGLGGGNPPGDGTRPPIGGLASTPPTSAARLAAPSDQGDPPVSTATLPVRQRVVLADLLPRTAARDVALVLGAALLTALCAQIDIPVPGSPVPISGQTFAVCLTAAALGANRGALGQLAYVALGAVGLPFYADGEGGVDVVFGATGGYLVGFVVAAWLMGRLAERGEDRRVLPALRAFTVGQLAIFAFGVPWLAVVAGLGPGAALDAGLFPFLLGGAIKAALAAALLPAAWRVVGDARR